MAKKKSQSTTPLIPTLSINQTIKTKPDQPLNFNDSNRILCAIHEDEEAVRKLHLVRCQPGVDKPFYHSFEEMQADIPFPVDFSHLNPLHVLPCGFDIETQAIFKEEVKDESVDTDEKEEVI